MQFDVIIIGGSYAGLSASLQLARARRKILIIDSGLRRNRFAEASHGFLTNDGAKASEIVFRAKEQVQAYPTVTFLKGKAVTGERLAEGFRVMLADSSAMEGKRLILATGVIDHLPEISGLAERWGKSVFHCPYCHGYELDQGQIGVLATTPGSMHLALMLPDWGPTTLFLNGAFEPDEQQLKKLSARGIAVERRQIERIDGMADLVMVDGSRVALAGLFTTTRIELASPIAAQLGCAIDDTPMGVTIKTDPMKATTIAGVYACGDTARPGGSLPLAVGDGTLAGAAAHQSLISGAL